MKKLRFLGTFSAFLLFAHIGYGQVIWNGTTATPNSGLTNMTGGTVTQYNNNGTTTLITTTSPSSGYSGATGSENFGAAARVGALNTTAGNSVAFQFTLTPTSGNYLSLTNIAFGSRSTSTGPQAYTVLVSTNNWSSSTQLATGSLTANSTWALVSSSITYTGSVDQSLSIRIFGHSGTGSPSANTANWRIDDLTLTATAIPEPSTYAAIAGVLALGGVMWHRRRKARLQA